MIIGGQDKEQREDADGPLSYILLGTWIRVSNHRLRQR
jgi:hypothetical protein